MFLIQNETAGASTINRQKLLTEYKNASNRTAVMI